ncbi:ATP-binding protein [Hymenobacter sp. GOD-10R]|uniref:ATP-binding protein n=1 Tax=Hymenobacter sp. GOD-10R TaxID=3093922 RepID=UPI002D783F9E|nr:ATP-binding protein [Hymenobacter sp. GOD-10R]WRQ31837.1 ATP-binding protein [Hymenobacter sp. GOD-10R]
MEKAALAPAVVHLLEPKELPQQDVRRLQAAHAQWAYDSLSRLLVYARLSADFYALQQADSGYRYLRLAWSAASPAQRRAQPAEVVALANSLANHYHVRGEYDSALVYYRQAMAVFRQARLDSSQSTSSTLSTTHAKMGGRMLARVVGHAGLASRHRGDLLNALHYYERAQALYLYQQDLPGIIWTQCLIGEAYAEQGSLMQALPAYEQALRTVRRYQRQDPQAGSHMLAGLALEYYAPLQLMAPRHQSYACPVATEAIQALQTAYSQSVLRATPHDAALLSKLQLVLAEETLRAGRFTAAVPYLRAAAQWLGYARTENDHSITPDYLPVQAHFLGLRAWQQHATNPVRARQDLQQAIILAGQAQPATQQAYLQQQLASYALAMGEPQQAQPLLQQLLRRYPYQSPFALSQVTTLLMQVYAKAGRYDSAYYYARRTQALIDTQRTAQHFALLADTEARFRTREQATQIQLLTARTQLALTGAALLTLLLLAAGAAWHTTRRLNRQLATQSRRLQEQAEQLGKLDAAKNQFFANVSHELRTPLTLILSPLDGLLTTPSVGLPPNVQAPVTLAHRHARRLLELVNRILDLTKLQAGRLELYPTPTALSSRLRQIVAQFSSLAAERRVSLAYASQLPDELHVLVDADKIEQILTNLCMNALKYTPAGGAVTVSAAFSGSASQYVLTVCDTGPGIAMSEQAHLFERYYQSPQAQAQGGTGLGLALSRDLATLLGGSLTLVSEPGQGAAFTLRFPAQTVPPALSEAPQEELIGAQEPSAIHDHATVRARILVVEDQPDLRSYLRDLLAPRYEVLTAEDGQDALEVLEREAPIDMLITDAMMPRLSGTELLTHLKAHATWASIPVLMLTARADEGHRLAALTLGIDDYLTKPFVTMELLARVQVLLTRCETRRHFAAQQPVEENLLSALWPLPSSPTLLLEQATPASLAAEQLAQWQAEVASELVNPAFGPAELAHCLCLSERTLYRRLGELAGLTPAAWLRELRLNHARRLLEAGSFGSVAEVAEATGFSNVKSFSQRYAERFGRRPSTYPK